MEVTLIDGGLGTELTSMGFCTENAKFWSGKWLIDEPNVVKTAHLNFIKSGAKIIETSSYQLSLGNLMNENKFTESQAKDIIKKSVEIGQQARTESKFNDVLIAGSVGPYGAIQCDGSEYHGRYAENMTEQELMEFHKPRIDCLVEASCDLLAIETIPCYKEAASIMNLLKTYYPDVKAWLTFSCKDSEHISNGETFKSVYDSFKDNPQLIAIGINCTSPFFVTDLLKTVSSPSKPFIVYPNDGREWDAVNQKFINSDHDSKDPICDFLREWAKLGAKYIGGCCNVGSKEIKIISEKIKTLV